MIERRCWEASLVEARRPRGTRFPSYHKIVPPQPFPARCPSLPAPGVIPKSSPEHTSQCSPPKQKGQAGGGRAPRRIPCQPLLPGTPAGLAARAPGSRIRSGLCNVKAVTQTCRKLKIKGEILYCNRTDSCFTEIWHRPGINKYCCITQLYMLHHLGKPLKESSIDI